MQRPTTDGFIRTPLRVNRKPMSAKAVRKQRNLLIADTVIDRHTSNENQARLVFYSKLSRQSHLGRSKNYSLAGAPVSRDLSIELFADEIETRLQNGLRKSHDETRVKLGSFATNKRHGRIIRQLSRTIRLL